MSDILAIHPLFEGEDTEEIRTQVKQLEEYRIELKPCPFCGGKGHIRYKNSILYYIDDLRCRKVRMRSYVQCGSCKARGGVFASTIWVSPSGSMTEDDKEYIDEQVSRMWNARAEDD